MKISRVAYVAILAAAFAGGCQKGSKANTKETAAAPVNSVCPISGNPIDASVTTEYKDQAVAFCCDMCPAKWEKLSDAEKDAALAKAK